MFVLALIFDLGVDFVSARLGVQLPRRIARQFPAAIGIDGEQGDEPFEIRALALGTCRTIAGAHKGLELVPAGTAFIFVYRHINPLTELTER